jgi:hypothetical protein
MVLNGTNLLWTGKNYPSVPYGTRRFKSEIETVHLKIKSPIELNKREVPLCQI